MSPLFPIVTAGGLLVAGCRSATGHGNAPVTGLESDRQSSVVNSIGQDTISPDDELQNLIHRLVHTPRYDANFYTVAGLIRAFARSGFGPGDRDRHIILQAALYGAHTPAPREQHFTDDIPNPKGVLFLIQDILPVPHARVAATLLPFLRTRDDRLRRFIFEVVIQGGTPYDEQDGSDPIVRVLLDSVGSQVEAPDWGVVQLLYWKAPSIAVVGLADRTAAVEPSGASNIRKSVGMVTAVTGQPAALAGGPVVIHDPASPGRGNKLVLTPRDRSRQAVAAAIECLDELSRFDEWWVKLYVAEMMRRYHRNPDLRDSAIVSRLRRDRNPIVRKAADVPFHHGKTRQERMWWWPFEVAEDDELKYLWRPRSLRAK